MDDAFMPLFYCHHNAREAFSGGRQNGLVMFINVQNVVCFTTDTKKVA